MYIYIDDDKIIAATEEKQEWFLPKAKVFEVERWSYVVKKWKPVKLNKYKELDKDNIFFVWLHN